MMDASTLAEKRKRDEAPRMTEMSAEITVSEIRGLGVWESAWCFIIRGRVSA